MRKKANESKKARIEDGSTFDVAFRPKFHKDNMPSPKYQGKGVDGQVFSTCHPGDCLASSSEFSGVMQWIIG